MFRILYKAIQRVTTQMIENGEVLVELLQALADDFRMEHFPFSVALLHVDAAGMVRNRSIRG